MAQTTKRGGKKNRKHGRNAKWCDMYRNQQTRGKNKARKIKKHLERYPDDDIAKAILKTLPRV